MVHSRRRHLSVTVVFLAVQLMFCCFWPNVNESLVLVLVLGVLERILLWRRTTSPLLLVQTALTSETNLCVSLQPKRCLPSHLQAVQGLDVLRFA